MNQRIRETASGNGRIRRALRRTPPTLSFIDPLLSHDEDRDGRCTRGSPGSKGVELSPLITQWSNRLVAAAAPAMDACHSHFRSLFPDVRCTVAQKEAVIECILTPSWIPAGPNKSLRMRLGGNVTDAGSSRRRYVIPHPTVAEVLGLRLWHGATWLQLQSPSTLEGRR